MGAPEGLEGPWELRCGSVRVLGSSDRELKGTLGEIEVDLARPCSLCRGGLLDTSRQLQGKSWEFLSDPWELRWGPRQRSWEF